MGDTMQHDAGGSMNAPAQGAQSVQGAQSAQTTQTEVVTQGLDYRRVAPVIPFSRAGWAQVGMYAILVALACIPGSNAASSATSSLMSFAVGLLVMLFAFFTPLRDGIPGRVIGVILGLLGMIFASTPLLGELVFGMAPPKEAIVASPGTLAVSAWFAGAGALLVTLVVVSFGRQMARLDRSNLIVQLSHMIMDGACTVLCSGWCFLPMLLQGFTVSKTENANGQLWVWLLCVIAVVAFAVVLGFMDRLWYRDAQPLEGAQAPWFGFAMMPVMITGGLVALATLIVQMTLTV